MWQQNTSFEPSTSPIRRLSTFQLLLLLPLVSISCCALIASASVGDQEQTAEGAAGLTTYLQEFRVNSVYNKDVFGQESLIQVGTDVLNKDTRNKGANFKTETSGNKPHTQDGAIPESQGGALKALNDYLIQKKKYFRSREGHRNINPKFGGFRQTESPSPEGGGGRGGGSGEPQISSQKNGGKNSVRSGEEGSRGKLLDTNWIQGKLDSSQRLRRFDEEGEEVHPTRHDFSITGEFVVTRGRRRGAGYRDPRRKKKLLLRRERRGDDQSLYQEAMNEVVRDFNQKNSMWFSDHQTHNTLINKSKRSKGDSSSYEDSIPLTKGDSIQNDPQRLLPTTSGQFSLVPEPSRIIHQDPVWHPIHDTQFHDNPTNNRQSQNAPEVKVQSSNNQKQQQNDNISDLKTEIPNVFSQGNKPQKGPKRETQAHNDPSIHVTHNEFGVSWSSSNTGSEGEGGDSWGVPPAPDEDGRRQAGSGERGDVIQDEGEIDGGQDEDRHLEGFQISDISVEQSGSEFWCWNVSNDAAKEVECRCWGPELLEVPSNLSSNVFRITVADAGLKVIKNDSFTRYHATLQDIVLENMKELETIEAGSFNGLHQLRSIYIHSAPFLKEMPNLTFTGYNTKLRSLRIASSGLESIPNMQFIEQKDIFHMIELDSNRIIKVHSHSIKVRVEELSLNYNRIQSVEKEAFDGSKIGKLSLKGNTHLTYLDPRAFEGIGSLRTLDLSETSITSLPTYGLTDLEVLRLEDTPSLKVFPSVYSFKTIQKAYLTYPYHCCAFQFPEQHDREQYIRHQEFIRKMEQGRCSDVMSPSGSPLASPTRVRRRPHTYSTPSPDGTGGTQVFVNPDTAQVNAVGNEHAYSSMKFIAPAEREDMLHSDQKWDSPRTDGGAEISFIEKKKSEFDKITKHKRFARSKRFYHRSQISSNPQQDNSLRIHKHWKEISPELEQGFLETRISEDKETAYYSRTRHNGRRAGRSRPKIDVESTFDLRDKPTASENTKGSKIRFRNRRGGGDNAKLEALIARHPGHHTELRLPPSNTEDSQRTKNAPDEEELIPSPNKRFENIQHNEELVGEGFAGSVGGAGFPSSSFLGFGSFNHTTDRYAADTVRSNESSHWGSSQGWSRGTYHQLPLDTGDDRTYGRDHFGGHHPLGSPEGEDGGGFHGVSEGFPDDGGFPDSGGEGFGNVFGDREQEEERNSEIIHDPNWHHAQAPMNNTTIVVLCGNPSKNYHDVLCIPAPDPFNPCEDIMGNLALRVAVWFVVVTAVVGNLAVMLVLMSSKFRRSTLVKIEQNLDAQYRETHIIPSYASSPPSSRMTVSKFLMVNLALADLCMGIYLLLIAAMDLHTIGVYFNHAIDWQNGPGCKVAGFLTVFASELSIFTLTVITSERWYAITYAIHLNKRLKLSMAAKIMVIGWVYSIAMATLPLVGISSYSKTSICLPMETGDALALAYLVSLLLVNGLAFFVITACYASMYCSISRHDATATHSDLTVAKRMALLVFTDFACWAPIAFFGLTAVAGLPLINVTRAKILLVFFYPLNSCANPYLYAILTKQYRRDLFILLARYGFCTKRAMRYKGAYSSVNNTFPHNTVVNAPNHRNSTLTQITLCDLTRAARTSQQSNNGSLFGTALVGGSQDSLPRSVSPLRTPTKPETCCAETERLSTVQEMSHSTHSDDESSDHGHPQPDGDPDDASTSSSSIMKQAGSPHPIKNCYTRLSFTPEQEEILKHALKESKTKKKLKRESQKENGEKLLTDNAKSPTVNGRAGQEMKTFLHGEAVVVCEVEVNSDDARRSIIKNRDVDEVQEMTSSV